MMLLVHVLISTYAILINFGWTTGQDSVVPECPFPWVSQGNKCYLFSKDPLPWIDAEIHCATNGAELISVNSDLEHAFLQNWFALNEIDPDNRQQWYTSGRAEPGTPRNNPYFIWADKTDFGSRVFWTNEESAKADNGDYVVYKYADTGIHESQPGYFWVRDDGLLPRPFICEIFKDDAILLTSKPRDFVFGTDEVHPDMVERGPYFVSQPQNVNFQVSVEARDLPKDSSSIAFDCTSRGYPQPDYIWYEDTVNGTVRVQSGDRRFTNITITSGRLTIHDPSKQHDMGSYWCETYNKFGKIRSEKGRINYITLEEFPKSPKNVTARAYDSAVIICEHDDDTEGARFSYRWFKNNDPRQFVSSVYTEHIFISASGSLYFSSVNDYDSAAYHCTVSVEGGRESRSSPGYNLIVDTTSNYQPVGPIIHNDFLKIIPKNPLRGDLVYLECFARFTRNTDEVPLYTWSRPNDRELPEGHELVDLNRRLIIHNIQPADEGEYICTVSSQQASNSKRITLSISAKPYFSEGRLDDEHLDVNDTFRWICLANGQPKPTYKWYRNGQLFDANSLPVGMTGRVTFSEDMRVVEFTNLKIDVDPGMYQCAATNAHGTTFSSAQMRVLEFGPSFVKHPMLGKVLATEEGNATIPCDPEAAPSAKISWLKDGVAYQVSKDSTSSKRLLPNNYLFLSGITRSVDEGIYTCVAENTVPNKATGEPFSKAQAHIELVVIQRSRLAFGPIDMRVPLFSRVVLQCRGDFDPRLDLVYIWYHNDRRLDFDDWKMAQIYSRGLGVSRGDLVIKNITYEERGQFRCTVMTKSDLATRSATVQVYGPPGEPAGIVPSNAGKHSVVISWSRGAENGAPVTSYLIEKYNEDTQLWVLAQNVTDPAHVASGNTTVVGLFANTGYLFRIKAVNKYGVGVASMPSTSIIKTSPDKPSTYPENIRAGGGKEGTLVIEWTPLPKEQWNAPNVQYIVKYRPDDGSDQGSWQFCDDEGQPIRHGSRKSGRCVVTLGNNLFYLPYQVQVYATNEMGNGPIPEPVTGMSAVRVPTQTPKEIVVQPYNATALTVYWNPVQDSRESTGGELLGFHIQYWKASSTQSLGRRNTILGNVTSGRIIGLEPNTDYFATAQPFNSAGDAPPGRSIPQTTWFNAPLNMPEYVTLNRTDGQYLGVHFNGVVTGPEEEPLDGYKVRIWRQGESLRNAKDYDCGRRTWIMIEESFEKNSFYNLRVFGYSRGGVGKMSSPLIQFTIGCNVVQNTDDTETQWVYLCNCSHHTLSFTLLAAVFLLQLYNYLS
ncbi:contactin-like [Watersipora subatra]|uniref:contactin-like n=1 Tax=Watersipora subatra TaxID=2589382 RepID=UPI00355B23BA